MKHNHDGVKLRYQFKRIAKMETTKQPNCDRVEIKFHVMGDRVTDAFLCFTKNGEDIAMAPISKSDFRKMKSDLAFYRKAKSGAAQRTHEQTR